MKYTKHTNTHTHNTYTNTSVHNPETQNTYVHLDVQTFICTYIIFQLILYRNELDYTVMQRGFKSHINRLLCTNLDDPIRYKWPDNLAL